MTEDATDGRPWPVDPPAPPGPASPTPVPELAVAEGVSDLLASFPGNSNGNGRKPATAPVTDEDRTTFGLLLDRAAERGLLSQSEYQLRLGELAEATTRDEMRRIVTELPVFVTPTPLTRSRRARKPAFPAVGEPTLVDGGQRRRSPPWVLLAVMVAVLLITLVFFAFYADHLIRQHANGSPGALRAWPVVSSLLT